jgi:hypothetical protein
MTEDQVLSVIRQLESSGLLRTKAPNGDWYQVYCPSHNNGQERKPSCGIALHDIYADNKLKYPAGFVHCFSCGFAKNMPEAISEILKLHSISRSGLDWLKENVPGFDPNDTDFDYALPPELSRIIEANFAVNYMKGKMLTKPVNYVSERELASYRLTVPYMYQRRLTDEIIEKYDIGYDANFIPEGRKKPIPCITFPLHDEQGRTLGFCRRSIQGKFFFITKDIQKPVYGMYELPDNINSLIICESCLNALTAVSYGYNAVALLGTGTPHEINTLKRSGVRDFVLCLDNDDAGHRGTAKLKKALTQTGIVWTMTIPPIEIKDPQTGEVTLKSRDVNDLSKEEFDYYYSQRQ